MLEELFPVIMIPAKMNIFEIFEFLYTNVFWRHDEKVKIS